MDFSKTLINWYLKSKRDLPWRKTSDPYNIWLSEIMLQQTRIEQGLPYYLKFVEEFPSVFDLADASQDNVMKLWQGLGYYSRARNLHETAKYVAYQLDGIFPKDYKGLLKLKGVGDYTASAIASISYNEPVAVVDGNVYRVLSRYFDIATPINSTEGVKEFKALAMELLDKEDPSAFNQALMEFGALQCKPKNPLCDSCPFNTSCLALKENKIGDLPVKIKKGKIKNRYFNYLVFSSEENKTLLQQRKGKGIWNGLYEFPLIETTSDIQESGLIEENKEFQELVLDINASISLYNDRPVIHKLSHQHIHARFWLVEAENLPRIGVSVEKVKEYPVPVLIQNFLNEIDIENL
ncbi:A/G-specific adenine glycosylase [Zunongwangia endophytica]|uniref:Adenine DNA glycosylase n=1 Tax=Zunongwangia endophytica TaxID=1808945 RepID=A0ABV8H7T8_9FLAO|nr:A/G-specific adenine glycosylase [Zunongwangia endophytica]MDN3595629.1 A/G-specific adenine glycosylase [Zunongwangia endophytica]